MTDLTTETVPAQGGAVEPRTTSIAVVIPMPSDPDWALFDHVPVDVPILVVDDSDGKLAPPPRENVTYFDYAAQRDYMGEANWPAIPHKSAATRNFGHYFAYTEGYDVIIALDYDCRTREGWLDAHLSSLGTVLDAPALQAPWINSVDVPGWYARGFPYEYRNTDYAPEVATASGVVKLNMGLWDNVLDLNGIDKLNAEPPYGPHVTDTNRVALGNIPVCGMNNVFSADLTPAYFFLPDLSVDGWKLSRHDDIWGGYITKKLMDVRGDLFTFGKPVVEHTRQTPLERVVVMEHWMHLMAREFFAVVDDAITSVKAADYATMFADFTESYMSAVGRSTAPKHYRQVYRELGESMQRWAACFA
jgi:hypothetical protein